MKWSGCQKLSRKDRLTQTEDECSFMYNRPTELLTADFEMFDACLFCLFELISGGLRMDCSAYLNWTMNLMFEVMSEEGKI